MAAHPGRTAPGRPPRAARPALVRPTMPVVNGYCFQHAGGKSPNDLTFRFPSGFAGFRWRSAASRRRWASVC